MGIADRIYEDLGGINVAQGLVKEKFFAKEQIIKRYNLTEEQATRLMEVADKSKDGRISTTEAGRIMNEQEQYVLTGKKPASASKSGGTGPGKKVAGSDGIISEHELEGVKITYAKSGKTYDANYDTLKKNADANGNGLGWDEFEARMRTISQDQTITVTTKDGQTYQYSEGRLALAKAQGKPESAQGGALVELREDAIPTLGSVETEFPTFSGSSMRTVIKREGPRVTVTTYSSGGEKVSEIAARYSQKYGWSGEYRWSKTYGMDTYNTQNVGKNVQEYYNKHLKAQDLPVTAQNCQEVSLESTRMTDGTANDPAHPEVLVLTYNKTIIGTWKDISARVWKWDPVGERYMQSSEGESFANMGEFNRSSLAEQYEGNIHDGGQRPKYKSSEPVFDYNDVLGRHQRKTESEFDRLHSKGWDKKEEYQGWKKGNLDNGNIKVDQ